MAECKNAPKPRPAPRRPAASGAAQAAPTQQAPPAAGPPTQQAPTQPAPQGSGVQPSTPSSPTPGQSSDRDLRGVAGDGRSRGGPRPPRRDHRRLRVECPWDREQDERSIVPHTVEEAYELADAAHSGDDAKLLDELGDVLFQVVVPGPAAGGAGRGRPRPRWPTHWRQKLIRRHPHVFGEVEAETAGEVLRNWDAIKRDEEGAGVIFGEIARERCPPPSTRGRCSARPAPGAARPDPSARPATATPCSIGELLLAARWAPSEWTPNWRSGRLPTVP